MISIPPPQKKKTTIIFNNFKMWARAKLLAYLNYCVLILFLHWGHKRQNFSAKKYLLENPVNWCVIKIVLSQRLAPSNEVKTNTHLTPIIWTSSSLAHSKRCLQFFRVVPNFMLPSSPPIWSSVAICSKTLREGEDDWGRVGLHHHHTPSSAHVKPEDCRDCVDYVVRAPKSSDGRIKWT